MRSEGGPNLDVLSTTFVCGRIAKHVAKSGLGKTFSNQKAPNRELKKQVVDRQGFEPWTLGLRVPCSSQLS